MVKGKLAGWILGLLSLTDIGLTTARAQVITTLAGTDWVFPGPSLPAKQAPLLPSGVAVDAAGNIYVSDGGNNQVMRITLDGILTVIAGNGIQGYSGDRGPATEASMNGPSGVAVDSAGNVYIADHGNFRVRKVSNGVITTVAGNGIQAYESVGIGDGGLATAAEFSQVYSVAVDSSGNLYVVDAQRVREVSNGRITTIAGTGVAGHTGDGGPATRAEITNGFSSAIALDSAGNCYIASDDYTIRRITAGAGIITTVAGNGTDGTSPDGTAATSASLHLITGIALDGSNNLYFAEGGTRIREVAKGVLATVAGTGVFAFTGDGPALTTPIANAIGMAIDSAGNLYIAEVGSGTVRDVAHGAITTVAGNGDFRYSGDGGPPTSAALGNITGGSGSAGVQGVAVDASDNIYFVDGNRVREVFVPTIALQLGHIERLPLTITTVAGNGNFGYSGDGGPATGAELFAPRGLAVDAEGALYIADTQNRVVRKVVNGTISTIAGNGSLGCSADGIAATAGSLSGPAGVAVDSSGNVYIADGGCNSVRKVSNGVITTVAGNGVRAYGGDGGPANKASFSSLGGIAIDQSGNIYLTDGNRVRKVSNGIVTTVAGNGVQGLPSGNGVAATSAVIDVASSIAVDSAGNFYFTDFPVVRKVSNGIITTVAGDGQQRLGGYGDGGLAILASMGYPSGVALDSSNNLFIADTLDNRVREVLASPPTAATLASTINLSSSAGGKPAQTTVDISATTSSGPLLSIPGLSYSATVTGGAPWLTVSPPSGNTPALLTITGDPLTLTTPKTYTGTVVVTVTQATVTTAKQTITVNFSVGPGVGPVLSVIPSQLSFTYATTSTARPQTLTIANLGDGTLGFTVAAGPAASWLSFTPAGGSATPANPASLTVTANPAGLLAGTYTTTLTITGTNTSSGPIKIPVVMTITTNARVLYLTQTGLAFTGIQKGGLVAPKTFAVLNLGSGTLSWNLQTSVLGTTANSVVKWLNASAPGASSQGASTAGASAPLVTVSVNQAALAALPAGIYYGLVQVFSGTGATIAVNSPLEVVVILQVLPANSPLSPVVQPNSVLFTQTTGQSPPSSQSLQVYDPTGTSISFRTLRSTSSGVSWLNTLPGDATIPTNAPANIVVQPLSDGFAAGTYTGTVSLQFSDGSVSQVKVTLIVSLPGTIATPVIPQITRNRTDVKPDAGSSGCALTGNPSMLIPLLTSLGPSFSVPANWSTDLVVSVTDDCGTPLTDGIVSIAAQGDPAPIPPLSSNENGRWDVGWTPSSSTGTPVSLTVMASTLDGKLSGMETTNGTVGFDATQVGINNVYSGTVTNVQIPTPLAPGGFIAIKGLNLSAVPPTNVPAVPLPGTFEVPISYMGTTVFIQNIPAPLSYISPTQVNAIVPSGVTPRATQSLRVQVNDATTPYAFNVNVADAQPGVFQFALDPSYTSFRAWIYDVGFNVLGPNHPAKWGQTIVIYCAGLGSVMPATAAGVASTTGSQTTNTVNVNIGGVDAGQPLAYSGLAPGLIGVYQINVVVPQNTQTGDAVPVILTVAGQTSFPALTSIESN
jgi:uncharacterized protein (TIGR03437 family)